MGMESKVVQESVCACKSLAYNWGSAGGVSDDEDGQRGRETHITVIDGRRGRDARVGDVEARRQTLRREDIAGMCRTWSVKRKEDEELLGGRL